MKSHLAFLKEVVEFTERNTDLDQIFPFFVKHALFYLNWDYGLIQINSEPVLRSFYTVNSDKDSSLVPNEKVEKALLGLLAASENSKAQAVELVKDVRIPEGVQSQLSLVGKKTTVIRLKISSQNKIFAEVLFASRRDAEFEEEKKEALSIAQMHIASFLLRVQTQKTMIQQEKMASLGEMAGGMAHEINTPLGAITLSAGQLKDLVPSKFKNRELVMEIVEDILSSAEKISRIVRGLKNFSRDSSTNDFVFCNLTEVLLDSLALCERSLDKVKIRLTADHSPDELSVQCNPSQISQVIMNLVLNARDAIMKNTEKWIAVSMTDQGDTVVFRVTDSGKGIPQEIQSKIFSPFFTTKEIGAGTGLGLSIAHGIVKKHGGTIFIDNDHENTSFVFQIPKVQSGSS